MANQSASPTIPLHPRYSAWFRDVHGTRLSQSEETTGLLQELPLCLTGHDPRKISGWDFCSLFVPMSRKSWIALLVSICPAPRTMPGSELVLNIYKIKLVYIQQREKICGVGMKKGGIRSNNSNLFSNIIFNGTRHHTSKEIHIFLFSKCDALNTQFLLLSWLYPILTGRVSKILQSPLRPVASLYLPSAHFLGVFQGGRR